MSWHKALEPPSNTIVRHVLLASPLGALWLCGLLLMYGTYGDLKTATDSGGFHVVTIEVIVLYGILRPSSFNYSWARAALAFALFAFLTGSLVLFMYAHAGYGIVSYMIWHLMVTFGLLLLLILCPIYKLSSEHRSTKSDWDSATPFMFPWELEGQELERDGEAGSEESSVSFDSKAP